MGRGDRRTKKGKITAGSYGISRPHVSVAKKKAVARKVAAETK
jgi:ribosomal small subunit protein bTHX